MNHERRDMVISKFSLISSSCAQLVLSIGNRWGRILNFFDHYNEFHFYVMVKLNFLNRFVYLIISYLILSTDLRAQIELVMWAMLTVELKISIDDYFSN